MPHAFPKTLDDITPDWLDTALGGAAKGDRRIVGHRCQELSAGKGQTASSARLLLDYDRPPDPGDGGGPDSVVIKMATPDGVRRAIALSFGMYDRELLFYRSFAAAIPVETPRCHFAEADDEGNFALLLEDFRHHRAGDETLGCTIADARLAVHAMARLHGTHWGRPPVADLPTPAPHEHPRFAGGWDEMIRLFGDHVPEAIRRRRDTFLGQFPALHQWMSSGPRTLIHGDFKLDNLLFDDNDDGGSVVLLDWQLFHHSRGIEDYAYFVTQNVDPDIRREHERDLITLYRDTLATFDIDYPEAQFIEDYRRAMLTKFSSVVAITGVMINNHERALRRKRALLNRATTALLDWDALALLP